MKKLCLIVLAVVLALPTIADAARKWKGHWYLRGVSECREIDLDRKGRTTLGVYPKAVVEEKDGDFFLTVEGLGKKYSYEMNERTPPDYDLDLISVGPNLPLPEAGSVPAEGEYSAIFRKMVDCQATIK